MGAKKVIQGGLRYQVGNGKSIRVWDSPWLNTTTRFKPETRRPIDCNIQWVSELMLSGSKVCNAELISRVFSRRDAEAILQIPISHLGQKDRLVWQFINNGIFSVNSAYQWLARQKRQAINEPESCSGKQQQSKMWKRLWSMQIKRKIKHFLWRAYHRIIPTNEKLREKGLTVDEWCKVCGEDKETMERMFFHCRKAQLIWKLSQVNWEGLQQFIENFSDWWIKVYNIGLQEVNQHRLEITACILWGI